VVLTFAKNECETPVVRYEDTASSGMEVSV
jgi:hypothetical protein